MRKVEESPPAREVQAQAPADPGDAVVPVVAQLTRPLPELSVAAHQGDVAAVRTLIRQGTDVDARDERGRTALMLAITSYADEPHTGTGASPGLAVRQQRAKRKFQIARMLVENGADVTLTGFLGYSVLHNAATADGAEADLVTLIDFLVERGAPINQATPEYGRTPLELAVQRPPAGRVACMLRHGADANVKTHEGKTLVSLAEAAGQPEIAELLRAALVGPASP
jgi:ankyrin repeat protein